MHPGGILLHLSTACNMRCLRCYQGKELSTGRSIEGTGCTIMTDEVAISMVTHRIEKAKPPSIVEIGGPGEPLVNTATYTLLRQLHTIDPDMPLSVWTNGVLLPDRLDDLVHAGTSRLTLSLPAATTETAENIYEAVVYRGRRHEGPEAAQIVLQQQWNGLSNAVEAGMIATIYVPVIAGVNDHEVSMIRLRAEEIGAERVVIVPLAG